MSTNYKRVRQPGFYQLLPTLSQKNHALVVAEPFFSWKLMKYDFFFVIFHDDLINNFKSTGISANGDEIETFRAPKFKFAAARQIQISVKGRWG